VRQARDGKHAFGGAALTEGGHFGTLPRPTRQGAYGQAAGALFGAVSELTCRQARSRSANAAGRRQMIGAGMS